MINSFQSISTITSGLILQQLEEEVIANNLAQPSVDSQGYLMNSLEQVNSSSNPSITTLGSNGLLSIGTGASAESITRLRSSFLDSQIQQQSMIAGYNEILSNSTSSGVMDQISSIVNGSTTLSSSLTDFATAWTNLSANPTSAGLQSDVVNAGVAFADEANSEYSQLQNLQVNMNSQVNQTVSQINNLLGQLASINTQLNQTVGSNQNSLLDARDYALDKLSRLVNYQVNYGSNGTANVWLDSVALVNGSSAATLQANISDPENPQLMDITVEYDGGTYASENNTGTTTSYNISSLITGGNLGGELYGRNVLLQSYKQQVDQIATSVLDQTNNLYDAGYVANSSTTGAVFFTGTGAANIAVNSVLTSAPTSLATEIQATSTPATANTPLPSGTLAQFLGNLPSLLANNYVFSNQSINKAGFTVSPTATIASQIFPTVPISYFSTTPTGGQFTVNGVTITYTTADSINDILNEINANVPNVYAVFNSSTQQFYMLSSGNIVIQEVGADNFTTWAKIKNVLTSTIAMNNEFATTDPDVVFGGANSALDSTLPGLGFNQGPNAQALFVTPGTSGTFTISGSGLGLNNVNISWTSTESLNQIKAAIQAAFPGANGISVSFNPGTQQLQLTSTLPMTITDDSGNFTDFTGLNGNLPLSDMASNISANATSQDLSYETANTSSSDSLTQLNNEQDNLAGVSTGTNNGVTAPGVPIATIEQQAYQSMITYNAMLEVMQIIDQMLDALVGVSSTSTTNDISGIR